MLFFENGKKNNKQENEQQSCLTEAGMKSNEKEEITVAPVREHAEETMETTLAAEEEVSVPTVPLPEPFFNLQDRIAYFGFSQRGQSHIASEAPCQDRCSSAFLPNHGYLILAVADGVGSCALSDLGADTAVNAVVEYLRKELLKSNETKLEPSAAGSLLRSAMHYAYDQVEQTAAAYEQLLYSLQSTLTAAIYDGRNLYFAHAGDDGIVALTADGTLALATTRHKGEEASSVYPLQEKSTWQFGMVPDTVAFVMATDGVLDAFVRNSFEKDRVYYPFIEPILSASYRSGQDVEQMCKDLYSYMMGKKYREAVTDDLTITVAMNIEKLSACLPKFDADAWAEETRKYEEMRRNALYNRGTEKPAPVVPKGDQPSESVPSKTEAEAVQPVQPVRDHPPRRRGKEKHRGWNKFRRWLAGGKRKTHQRNTRRSNPYEPYLYANDGRGFPVDDNTGRKNNMRNPSVYPLVSKKNRRKWSALGIAISIIIGIIFALFVFLGFRFANLFVSLLLSWL